MTIAAKNLTFTNFFFQPFNGCMSSSNNTTNAETLIFSIAVVKLDTCGMVLATVHAAKLTLVSPEPLP